MPQRRRMFLASSDHILAEHLDLARGRGLQADDRSHEDRLAGAGPADDADDLAAADGEIEILMDDLIAEAIGEAAHRDDRLAILRDHIHPTELKKTANTASMTMTRKID